MSSYSPGLTEHLPPVTWLQGPKGRLAFYSYPSQRPWLHLLISHGFGEHSGWWHHVGCALRDCGMSAYLFDHYHHGRSDGPPADVADFGDLVAGLRTALQSCVASGGIETAPVVLLGHSNGALIALLALRSPIAERVAGVVLASPFLEMPRWVAMRGTLLAHLLAAISPSLALPAVARPHRLTGNRAIWPQYDKDPLRHKRISARFFLAMRRALDQAREVAHLDGLPLLLLAAGNERVVDAHATEQWFGRLRAVDKQIRVYPGLRHELFNETVWEEILHEVVAWCRTRFGDPSAQEVAK